MTEAHPREVTVIGGGITGLAAAHELRRLGADVVLVEQSERLGGKIATESVDGFLVELGPDSFVAPKQAVVDLATELGFADRIISVSPGGQGARVWWSGALHPLPEGLLLMAPSRLMPLLRSSLLSWRGKARILADLVLPRGPSGDQSLESFVVRRLGREVLERIAEPLIAGIHAAEPSTMSLQASFPRFLDMERDHRSLILAARRASRRRPAGSGVSHFASFRDGMGTLTRGLIDAIDGVDVLTHTTVKRIDQTGSGYRVVIDGDTPFDTASVVLATPAEVTADLVDSLDSAAAAEIRQIRQVSTATVTLAYRTDEIPPLVGSGFVVTSTANRRVMGVSFLSNKWAGRVPDERHALIRAFVGGVHGRRLAVASEDEILSVTTSELAVMMGITAEPVVTRVASWAGGLHQYKLGHLERVQKAESLLADHPGVVLAGAAFHGIGLNECITSGRRAAHHALQGTGNPVF